MGTFRNLSDDVLKLLIAVQEKPLATIEELSSITNISKPTVAKRIKILEGVRPDKKAKDHPEGRYFTTTPVIDNHAIGLDYYGVIVEAENIANISKLEKLADDHPYTQFRSRCFGKYNGVLMQFRTPIGTIPLIEKLFEELKSNNTIVEYNPMPLEESPAVYTNLSVKGWNSFKMNWDFDVDKWFTFKKKVHKSEETRETGIALQWMTKKDVHIIQEIMGGARRRNLEIINALKRRDVEITPQTFSRRYKLIQKDCFNGYRTNFDPTIFDIYNTVLIMGEGEKVFLNELRTQLLTNPFPFLSTLRISGNHLFWFLRIQSIHLSKLITNLYERMKSLSFCYADYSSSKAYYVWPDAFDDDLRGWITSQEFIVDNVLANL